MSDFYDLAFLMEQPWPASRRIFLKSLWQYYLIHGHFTEAQDNKVRDIMREFVKGDYSPSESGAKVQSNVEQPSNTQSSERVNVQG